MITVRLFGPSDWKILRDIRLAALLDSPEHFGGTYADAVARPDAEWEVWPRGGRSWGAFVDDAPAGMVALWDDPANPSVTVLIGMWVAPTFRGSGVADALVQTAISSAVKPVDLTVYDTNPRAHAFYKRFGFTEFERSSYNDNPAWTMRYPTGHLPS